MFGIIFTLEDGTEIAGAIMHDGNVYLHNPICDTYHSQEDALADHPGASMEVVGPVIGINMALNTLEDHYQRSKAQIAESVKQVDREYTLSKRQLLKYTEALAAQGKENEEKTVEAA